MARCHQDFWEFEESSTGEAALSRLGIGTGMWPLSSVGNCRGQKIFKIIIADPLGQTWILYIPRQTISGSPLGQRGCKLFYRDHQTRDKAQKMSLLYMPTPLEKNVRMVLKHVLILLLKGSKLLRMLICFEVILKTTDSADSHVKFLMLYFENGHCFSRVL